MHGFVAVLILGLLSPGGAEQSRPPNAVVREWTTTSTVDRVERSSRLLTLRSKDNVVQTVHVETGITVFDDLRVGDVVTVRYTESVIVAVRSNATLSPTQDTTAEARKNNEQVIEQLKRVVTIDSVDSQRLSVTYRTHDDRKELHPVHDKALLEGIRPGDRVEITMTRARAVSIERGRR